MASPPAVDSAWAIDSAESDSTRELFEYSNHRHPDRRKNNPGHIMGMERLIRLDFAEIRAPREIPSCPFPFRGGHTRREDTAVSSRRFAVVFTPFDPSALPNPEEYHTLCFETTGSEYGKRGGCM